MTSAMTLNTDAQLMSTTAGKVETAADDLTGALNDLMTRLEPLQDQWKGAGAGSFQQVRQRFDEDMAKLNVALRAIAEAVKSAGTDYAMTDDEIRTEMDQAGATAGQITQALTLN